MSFFNNINPFRGSQSTRPSRPQPSSFSQPQPSSSFNSQPSNSFNPQPSSSSNSGAQSANLVIRPSSSSSSSSPSSFSSSSSSSSSSALNEIPAPAQQSRPAPPVQSQGSSRRGNHQWRGGDYLLSWREGRNSFSHSAARSYCAQRGMRIVSLDSRDKAEHFMRQVAADGSPYFWAGGRISSDKRTLTWENGRSEGIRRGQHPWSFTGSRGAQPDGRGSEHCLAILNNFYNDGVKFHDVGCSHTKPTVCEA